MSWNKTEHNFGKVLQLTKVSCEFHYQGDKNILPNVRCGCGCSTPSVNGKVITIGFDAPVVPMQVVRDGKGFVESSKNCTITLQDPTTMATETQVLTFKAQIYAK